MSKRNLRVAIAGGTIALALGAGVGWAAMPGDGGVIQGCYDSGGNVKVVPTLPCPKGYTALAWSQQGPKGDKGDKGDQGPGGAKDVRAARVAVGAPTLLLYDLAGVGQLTVECLPDENGNVTPAWTYVNMSAARQVAFAQISSRGTIVPDVVRVAVGRQLGGRVDGFASRLDRFEIFEESPLPGARLMAEVAVGATVDDASSNCEFWATVST